MSKLTVVMPAAGKGSRLGLPYPKEIMHLEEDKALIDYSFDFFKNRSREEVEFVVIINEHKTDIVKYLSRYKDRYNISFTYQNSTEHEYTGAIKSGYHLFGENASKGFDMSVDPRVLEKTLALALDCPSQPRPLLIEEKY